MSIEEKLNEKIQKRSFLSSLKYAALIVLATAGIGSVIYFSGDFGVKKESNSVVPGIYSEISESKQDIKDLNYAIISSEDNFGVKSDDGIQMIASGSHPTIPRYGPLIPTFSEDNSSLSEMLLNHFPMMTNIETDTIEKPNVKSDILHSEIVQKDTPAIKKDDSLTKAPLDPLILEKEPIDRITNCKGDDSMEFIFEDLLGGSLEGLGYTLEGIGNTIDGIDESAKRNTNHIDRKIISQMSNQSHDYAQQDRKSEQELLDLSKKNNSLESATKNIPFKPIGNREASRIKKIYLIPQDRISEISQIKKLTKILYDGILTYEEYSTLSDIISGLENIILESSDNYSIAEQNSLQLYLDLSHFYKDLPNIDGQKKVKRLEKLYLASVVAVQNDKKKKSFYEFSSRVVRGLSYNMPGLIKQAIWISNTSPKDIEKYVLQLKYNQKIVPFESIGGAFVNEMLRVVSTPSTFSLKPNFSMYFIGYGMKVDHTITITGDLGDGTGLEMEKGNILVKGDSRNYTGYRMIGGHIVVEGNSGDKTGAFMEGGTISIHQFVGNESGSGMEGGQLLIQGNCGNNIGEFMRGGNIEVRGNAYNGVGRFMYDGVININGDCRNRAGASMQGGKIMIHGNAENYIGEDMKAGEIYIDGNCGENSGWCMKNGLIHVKGNSGDSTGVEMFGDR